MDEKFKLKILLYHGVTSVKSKGIENISKKHLDIQIFEKQMRYLNKYCSVLSIDEVVNLYSKKKKKTFLGLNSTIGHMVNVGQNCFIGANTLITKNLRNNSVCIVNDTKKFKLNTKNFYRLSEFK